MKGNHILEAKLEPCSSRIDSRSPSLPLDGEVCFENNEYLDVNVSMPFGRIETQNPTILNRLKEKKVLVMGSGNGSNFDALFRALDPLGVDLLGLFCDRPDARIIERALDFGLPVFGPQHKVKQRDLNDLVLAFLERQDFDALLLAGYMRILPQRIVAPYYGKILNLHPSLLPDFPGLNSVQKAFDAKMKSIGITVHLVNANVDDGPILAQAHLPCYENETVDDLESRIHKLEHLLYPRTVIQFLLKCSQS